MKCDCGGPLRFKYREPGDSGSPERTVWYCKKCGLESVATVVWQPNTTLGAVSCKPVTDTTTMDDHAR
jgi:hypothetical protein